MVGKAGRRRRKGKSGKKRVRKEKSNTQEGLSRMTTKLSSVSREGPHPCLGALYFLLFREVVFGPQTKVW